MILFITLSMLPVLFAKKDVPCDSCCPPKPAPDGDAESCSSLSDKIQMLQNAINLSSCGKGSASSSAEDAGVCMTVTMQAIPPCMLKEGSTAQGECLIEAAKAISKELNAADYLLPGLTDEASGLEIVKKCKCDAFNKMLSSLVDVKEMICVDDSRNAKHQGAQHYSANTLWFQYAMCQGLDFSCYFFTNNWNQGDFGQYYLYDNILGDSNLLGGDGNNLLPILALSGGLGGGLGGVFGGGQGGHVRTGYSAEVDCVLTPNHADCMRGSNVLDSCEKYDFECHNKKRGGLSVGVLDSECKEGDTYCHTRKRRSGKILVIFL